MAEKKVEVLKVQASPDEPLEHRCACGIVLWGALKRQDLPAPGIVHTCPECGKSYARVTPEVKADAPAPEAPAAADDTVAAGEDTPKQ